MSSFVVFGENIAVVVLVKVAVVVEAVPVGVAVVVAIVSALVEGVEVEHTVFEIDPRDPLKMFGFGVFE